MSAALAYDTTYEAVSEKQRKEIKTVNFATIYGKSPKNVAEELGIPLENANKIFNIYFKTYGKVAVWMEYEKARLRWSDIRQKDAFAVTPYGHWRFFPYGKMKERERDRKAINFLVQGSAAICCHEGIFIHSAAWLEHNAKSLLTMQHHDAAIFDLHPDELFTIPQVLKDNMENRVVKPWFLGVPIKASMSIGISWYRQVEMTCYNTGIELCGKAEFLADTIKAIKETQKCQTHIMGKGPKAGQMKAYLQI
jgi:DNA polymerase-1